MRRPYNGTYSITRPFGVYDAAYANYPGSRHPGCDYGLPYRTPLIAAISGTAQVIDRGTAKTGRGREVVITNGSTQVKYCHMDSFSISNGQVAEGQVIGHSGFTGYVMDSAGNIGTIGGTHLHFETLINGVYQNPENQYNQGGSMTDEAKKEVYRAALHREPENDTVWRGVSNDPQSALKDARASTEWLTQNHVLKVAYPDAVKLLNQMKIEDKAQLAKIAELNTQLETLQSQKSQDTILLDEAGNWFTKLFNRLTKRG